MKNILFVVMAVAIMTACGGKTDRNAATKVSADAAGYVSDHNHDHEADVHIHDDGSTCAGNHAVHEDYLGHESHEGHAGHEDYSGHEGHMDHEGHDHSAEPHFHDNPDGEAEVKNPDEIFFSPKQAARTDFKVEAVSCGQFHEVIPTSGQVLPAPGDEITLVAPVAGVVSFASNKLAEGTQIGTSGTLFYVSSRNMASGDALARDANAYTKAKSDLERAEKLLADRIVSQAEYDALKAVYEDAKNSYEALAGNATEKGAAVKSRIPGYVTSLSVAEGDYAEAGQQLATVSQNRRLVLRAEVSQRYIHRLPGIRSANFVLPYDDTVWALDDLDGRLLSAGRNVTAGTPLIPITFEFNNNGRIVAGSYVDVKLIGQAEENVLTVPITSVSEQQGLYYVYVRLDEERYMRREVKTGADDGVNIRILSGLRPDERVVTRGAVNLKMAAASGAIPHGHEH